MMKFFAIRTADLLDPEKKTLFEETVNKFEEDASAVDVMVQHNVLCDDGVTVVALPCATVDMTTRSLRPISASAWDKKMKRLISERA